MKKLIYVIAITIVLLVCVICLKNEYNRKLYKNANYGIEALIKQKKVDNLFIGSSMFRQGLDIYAIERNLGINSYILAYNGNQPAYEFLELKYLIENGVQIENLYLDLYVYSAASTPKISDIRLLAQTDTRFKIDVWNLLKSCGEANLSVFWEMFVTANNESLLTFPVSHKLTNNLYHKGGNVQKNNGTSFEKLTSLQVPKVQDKIINSLQKEKLLKIIEFCKLYNINLVFIETPKWYKVCEDNDYKDLMKEYLLILNENNIIYYLSQKTAENLHLEDGNFIDFDSYDPDLFIDMVHMSSKGREEYSLKLLK